MHKAARCRVHGSWACRFSHKPLLLASEQRKRGCGGPAFPKWTVFPSSCIIGSASAQKLGHIGSESIILRHLCTASTCPLEKWLRTEQGKWACKQGLVPPTLLRLCRGKARPWHCKKLCVPRGCDPYRARRQAGWTLILYRPAKRKMFICCSGSMI